MKKVLLVSRRTKGAYVGGVISILNHYMANKDLFAEKGYEIEQYNYEAPPFVLKLPSKLQNIVYGILQAKALSNKLHECPDAIVHIHTSREFLFLKDIYVAQKIFKSNKAEIVMTIHVGTYGTVFNRIGFAEKWCLKVLNKCIKKVVFLSDAMRKEFEDHGMDPKLSQLLYNFHSLSQIHEESAKKEGMQLLFVGAIHREKGILELLNALNKIDNPKIHLNICGKLTDSSIKTEFENLVQSLEGRVKVCGYVSGDEKTRIFREADVLILPSYHEGFPLVILEGMASSCALISTPVGSTVEVLSENNVIWVGIKSVEDIKNAIEKLYANPTLLNSMKVENYKLSKEFTIEKNIQKSCLMYDEL